jgi:hypothetical protein
MGWQWSGTRERRKAGPCHRSWPTCCSTKWTRELEKRGHAFVRYADDCNVYVRSRRAGERVMGLLRRLYAGLRLQINEAKSAVAPAWNRKLLGYSFWVARDSTVRRRVADKALATMKDSVRDITKRTGGRSIEQVCKRLGEYLRGWKEYFRLADTPRIFDNLDRWIRRRLRVLHLKHWGQQSTVYRELRARGMSKDAAMVVAVNCRRWWMNSGRMHSRGTSQSLLRPARRAPTGHATSTSRTARCGPACRVVWQGSLTICRGPYADQGVSRWGSHGRESWIDRSGERCGQCSPR